LAKISCSSWVYREWEIERAIPSIAGIGYGGVEVVAHQMGRERFHLRPDFSNARQIVDLAERSGVKIPCIDPSNDFLNPRTGSVEGEVAHIKRSIDVAVEMGVPVVRPFATGRKPEAISREKALQTITGALRECADYAASAGVKLALENHGEWTSDPRNFIDIVRGVKSDSFGACLHTREGYLEILDALAPRVLHTHLVDARKVPEEAVTAMRMVRRGVPIPEIAKKLGMDVDRLKGLVSRDLFDVEFGRGQIDIRRVVATLRDAGYTGWYNFEGHRLGDPEADARQAHGYLVNLLKEMGIK